MHNLKVISIWRGVTATVVGNMERVKKANVFYLTSRPGWFWTGPDTWPSHECTDPWLNPLGCFSAWAPTHSSHINPEAFQLQQQHGTSVPYTQTWDLLWSHVKTLAMLLKNTTPIVKKRKRDCLLTILILCILDSCLHTKPHYVARPSILLIAESYFLRHLRAIPKFQKYLY